MINTLIKDKRLLIKDTEIKKPVMIEVFDFNNDTMRQFRRKFSIANEIEQPVIPIVINSLGGDVNIALEMVQMIESSEIPVATLNMGSAFSAGAILCGFGTQGYRYAAPDSDFMIHEISTAVSGKAGDIEAEAGYTRYLNDRVYEKLAKHCKKKQKYFLEGIKKNANKDWFFDAKEALKHGLIDAIKIPRLETRVIIEYEFFGQD